MALKSQQTRQRSALDVARYFTAGNVADEVTWQRRDARLVDHRDGSVAFEQLDVEVPASWSQNATNILAQKYFRGSLDEPDRERSLREVVDRIVATITSWGERDGYFTDPAGADSFRDELSHLLITQKAAFNSPVWFNIGVAGVPQQASACFILSVDDTMESILEWYGSEGRIFKGGSGAGANLSAIRASSESLRGGGTASGPVSFMRGADASAGTIKSGGKTRRAAKMVILDVDHPDIGEFIWCKAREERKARALDEAGFEMGIDGRDSYSVQYQNANNSVRVSDEFMRAVLADAKWDLTARTDGSIKARVSARDLFAQIAAAAWECADPGLQFDTTINHWNTAAASGRINASNPCSEYMHLDDSACNLASLNLLSFLDRDSVFDIEGFRQATEVVFMAQEILVGNADYPTPAIAGNSHAFRQIGMGYANLGALLMALGLPYDSDEGRALATAITALMTGQAYLTSTKLAARLGPFAGYQANREPMLRVLDQHRAALAGIDDELVPPPLLSAVHRTWQETCRRAAIDGVRNAQATVLAPTGTIGLLMDCDTTGIEPDLALVKLKHLVGGGTMTIVNQTVPRALRRLGYDPVTLARIVAHIDQHHSALGAPGLDPCHLGVLACSLGDNQIDPMGHVKMMGAVQPFLSGAISKTVNLPANATVDDVEQLFMQSWRLGLKAVAVYRDNSKVAQPLSAAGGDDTGNAGDGTGRNGTGSSGSDSENRSDPTGPAGRLEPGEPAPVRRRLPRARASRTFEFQVADCKGFVTVGEYDDGRPGEIFLRVSKQGSTLAGIMDAFAISLSHGLQYGVPLSAFVETFVRMRFEPAGLTDDPDIRIATSLIDYLFRKLAVMYLDFDERAALGVFTTGERTQPTLPGVEEQATETVPAKLMHVLVPPPGATGTATRSGATQANPAQPNPAQSNPAPSNTAPFCMTCGVPMQPSGSCHVCAFCGTTNGCS